MAALRREGYGTLILKQQALLHHPDANGFELNRAVLRCDDMIDIQIEIRNGTPPTKIIARYPLPPSSTGPIAPPNSIKIDALVLVEWTGHADSYIVARAEGVSGDTWLSYLGQIDALVAFKQFSYSVKVFTVVDYCKNIQ